MKKIVSLLMAAVMTAAAPAAVFAELSEAQKTVVIGKTVDSLIDDSFADGQKWVATGRLSSNQSDADNFKSDGSYTWIDTIKGAWSDPGYNNISVQKDFVPIAEGESLEFSAVVKPIKTDTPNKGQHINIELLSSDPNKVFTVFYYNVKSGEQIKTDGGGYTASIANSTESTGNAADLSMHGKDVEISANIKPAGETYTASVIAVNAADGTVYLSSEVTGLSATDVMSFSRARIRVSADWYSGRVGNSKMLGIKSVKLNKIADGVLREDTGIRLNEKVYDQTNLKGITSEDNKMTIANYINGNMWFANAIAAWHDAFASDGVYMWMQTHSSGSTNVGTLTRRFDGIADGAQLDMSFEFKTKTAKPKQGTNYSVSLTDTEGTNRLNILTLVARSDNTETYHLGVGGLNQNINDGYVNGGMPDYTAKKVKEWSPLDQTKEYSLEMSLLPMDEQNYMATIIIRNKNDNTVVEELTNGANPLIVSREIAESLNTVELSSFAYWGVNDENRVSNLGVRNIVISASNGEKTKLVNGENKIYVPYEILSKTPLSAAVCAAVVNKDGVQTDFDVVNLDNVIKYKDNVELSVNITDAKNDYVKVFAFDSTGTLVPLMDVKTLN